jgi:hypothetical protein
MMWYKRGHDVVQKGTNWGAKGDITWCKGGQVGA